MQALKEVAVSEFGRFAALGRRSRLTSMYSRIAERSVNPVSADSLLPGATVRLTESATSNPRYEEPKNTLTSIQLISL